MSKQRLGKGLQALISEMSPPEAENEVQSIPVKQITANPFQPRRVFCEDSLQELAESIKQHGLIQPVTVRRRAGRFELVVGERRWRAVQLAGLTEISAVVRDLGDQELMEIAIIENLQREDLNPVEEAEAYRQLMDRLGYTQEQLAETVGKSRPYIANTLRLLSLAEDILAHVSRGTISPGHARAILATPQPRQQELVERIVAGKCTVRQAEVFAREAQQSVSRETKRKPSSAALDPEWSDLQRKLQERLQAKVHLHVKGEKGSIEIEYYNTEELERLLDILAIR